jgi:hypothetical protein
MLSTGCGRSAEPPFGPDVVRSVGRSRAAILAGLPASSWYIDLKGAGRLPQPPGRARHVGAARSPLWRSDQLAPPRPRLQAAKSPSPRRARKRRRSAPTSRARHRTIPRAADFVTRSSSDRSGIPALRVRRHRARSSNVVQCRDQEVGVIFLTCWAPSMRISFRDRGGGGARGTRFTSYSRRSADFLAGHLGND